MAAVDRKRVFGPESSVVPVLIDAEKSPKLFDEAGKRLDQRTPADLRPICMAFPFLPFSFR